MKNLSTEYILFDVFQYLDLIYFTSILHAQGVKSQFGEILTAPTSQLPPSLPLFQTHTHSRGVGRGLWLDWNYFPQSKSSQKNKKKK